MHSGILHLAAGLSVGLTGLAAGYAIGIVGDQVNIGRVGTKFDGLTSLAGCSIIYATVTDICGYGLDPYFWRSAWSIWVCCLHPLWLWRIRLTKERLIVALILNTKAE